MSISMEHFGWSSIAQKSTSMVERARLSHPFQLQCRTCGFEPENQIIPPRRCPKCASSTWERFPKPGGLLANVSAMDPWPESEEDDDLDA
jgi:hypothetical protein